jgi:hypothetical protein
MVESIHVKGEGGTVIKMDLPLPSHIAQRLISGQIQRVNSDGSPHTVVPGAPSGPVAGPPLTQPAKTAVKDQWVGWAVVSGADPEEANGMTKNDLIEKYGTPQPGE